MREIEPRKPLLTAHEAHKYLGVPLNAIYSGWRSKSLPLVEINGRKFVPSAKLNALLGHEPPPEASRDLIRAVSGLVDAVDALRKAVAA